MPSSRFKVESFTHTQSGHAGTILGDAGYFLDDDPRLFDNAFFGINNLEATSMDPQQRQLLEVVYECFESAGVSLEAASAANVGCYVGNFTNDFQLMAVRDVDEEHRYTATGSGLTILANRINHVLNLSGPSLVLDTACSSALYALHLACSALARDDCTAAIVAGANLIQSPETFIAVSQAGVISPSSTCHSFDASADGYARAEGVGVLYLKRLSDAIRDNDPIRSVIRGTAVNRYEHILCVLKLK